MAEGTDWLPHEPVQQPPPRSAALRTVGIWAVLVILFVAIYALIGSESPYPYVRVGYSGWWIVGAMVATLALVVLAVAVMFGGAKKFNEEQSVALEMIAEGKYEQAAEAFGAIAKRYRSKPSFAAVATYNRGYALLRAGDTERAAGILLAVERTANLKLAVNVRKLAALQLARCFAYGGDVAKARTWLEFVKKHGAGMPEPVHDKAMLDALEGLVLCREGKFAEARAHFDQGWHRISHYLQLALMTEVWLMRAYAVAGTSSPRDAGAIEPHLRMLRGADLQRYTKHWPELATFVTTQLSAAA